jgi:hypothetical protein
MPKLNVDQIISRLEGRIAQLEAGEEIAKKDILALLTDEQQKKLEDALTLQAELKKTKRARTEEEKKALGWKSIREVRLETLKEALREARDGVLDDFERRQRGAEVRQMRIYMDAINEMLKKGKDINAAKIWANNELTRAGLQRMDGQMVMHMTKRDREVKAMETKLLEQFRNEATEEEREQLRLLEKGKKAPKKGKK